MAKTALSITRHYVPDWDNYAGVRDLLQNGRDAEIQLGAKLTVRHNVVEDKLVLENDGCQLPGAALLLGHTTKATDKRTAGHFGEGLKLGLLALVRAGHPVKINTGLEIWTPSIERAPAFGNEEVLTITTRTLPRPHKKVTIEINGITQKMWAGWRDNFLFLRPQLWAVETGSGRLLLDSCDAGRVYVHGIFVMTTKGRYGYDMAVETDRDRRVIEDDVLETAMAQVLAAAAGKEQGVAGRMYKALLDDVKDVQGAGQYEANRFPLALKQNLGQMFKTEHGSDALPVSSQERADELARMHLRAVVLPATAAAVLESCLGIDVGEQLRALKRTPSEEYDLDELTAAEQLHFRMAHDALNRGLCALGQEPMQVQVVSFPDPELPGAYDAEAKLCRLARPQLGELKTTLVALSALALQQDWDARRRVDLLAHSLAAVLARKAAAKVVEPAPAAADFVTCEIGEMTHEELAVLGTAVRLLTGSLDGVVTGVDIGAFTDPGVMAVCEHETLLVARSALGDVPELVAAIAQAVAPHGPDLLGRWGTAELVRQAMAEVDDEIEAAA